MHVSFGVNLNFSMDNIIAKLLLPGFDKLMQFIFSISANKFGHAKVLAFIPGKWGGV
jgi:hypothetical protein